MADVFISYSKADQAVARRVATALQAAGFDVWWDADLPAHRSYSEVIERNLADAKAVVVLWSASAAQSQWVRAEADIARNSGKLVQASIDGLIPPIPFNQIQSADLKGWRGKPSHDGWRKVEASVRELGIEGRPSEAPPTRQGPGAKPRTRLLIAAAAVLLLIATAAAYFLSGRFDAVHRPVVAVMPFTAVDPHDASLVAGMWEDTRRAIGRNPQLVVLGPNSVQQLASKDSKAAAKATDYLVSANVRSADGRIRVSTELVDAKTGTQMWSQSFDRKIDDVFALQSQIASEIEGRIRGRLAKKGGVLPEQIATTPDVYALYNYARATIRRRDYRQMAGARDQLLQVVKLDPNFAPGWATLSEVSRLVLPSHNDRKISGTPEQYARKAIDLAPNLSAGHSALALALDLKGPVALAEIERAIELDPNDYEAMHWASSVRQNQGDLKGALEAVSRAVEIEPLFWPAVLNKFALLEKMGDESGIQQLLRYERSKGADYFASMIEMDQAQMMGELARATNIGLKVWASGRPEARTLINLSLWGLLLELDFPDEALKISPAPDFAVYLWRNDPKGLDLMESQGMDARTFFSISPLTENAGRVYLLSGRPEKLASMYLSLRLSPEQFEKIAEDPEHFLNVAPLVAIALRRSGQAAAATSLLALAETRAKDRRRPDIPLDDVLLARIYAVEGRKADALPLLIGAVSRGWLPLRPMLMTDLALDPAWSDLKSDLRFEAARQRILATISRERGQVNLRLLNQVSKA